MPFLRLGEALVDLICEPMIAIYGEGIGAALVDEAVEATEALAWAAESWGAVA